MTEDDLNYMTEAVEMAYKCDPIKEEIPRVAAIIVADDGKVIGRGIRGNGGQDDEHAEHNAIEFAKKENDGKLAGATLYTTLEPCTQEVRRKSEKCCLKLIERNKISRVFVGMLDPNPGVTGKGLLALQQLNVEISLFPHDLSRKIQEQNSNFIGSQQTLGATIISPTQGEELRTFESGGDHPVTFKARNPPRENTYLIVSRGGKYWPQRDRFRQDSSDMSTWQVKANFGSLGNYDVLLVTANELGMTLLRYFTKVADENEQSRNRLRGRINMSLLGDLYPPIEMQGALPMGLRLEASVPVVIVPKVILHDVSVTPTTIAPGKTLRINYDIEFFEDISTGIWLGSSFDDAKSRKLINNTSQDRTVGALTGRRVYSRELTIPTDVSLGAQTLRAEVWYGVVSKPSESKVVGTRPPTTIQIVEGK